MTPAPGPLPADGVEAVSEQRQHELIKAYDQESNFRRLAGLTALLVTVLAVTLSSFHVYTAGFGLLDEIKHRSFHLTLVLGLVFLVFPRQPLPSQLRKAASGWAWSLAFAAFYLYLGWDLVESLRAFGGPLAESDMWVFLADPEGSPWQNPADENTVTHELRVPDGLKGFLFSEKVCACAQAERMAAGTVESLVWVSSDTLVVGPPVLYELGMSHDAAFRPVHIRNIGLPADVPLDPFWRRVCDAVWMSDMDQLVESFVDGQTIRAYFNSHSCSVNPTLGLFTAWQDSFQELVSDSEFQAGACADDPHQVFLHQAVLSALVVKSANDVATAVADVLIAHRALGRRLQQVHVQQLDQVPAVLHPRHEAADRPRQIGGTLIDRSRATRRVTLVGASTNASLALAQLFVGWLGHSQALVADSLHTFSDLLSDGIAYFAARHAHQAPDDEHPYGHGRYETAATLAIAVLLSLVGLGIAWSAGSRLFDPASLLTPDVLTLWAAAITTVTMTMLKLPISTSQAVVGAIVGVGLLQHQLHLEGLVKVAVCWVGTPLAGILFAVLVAELRSGAPGTTAAAPPLPPADAAFIGAIGWLPRYALAVLLPIIVVFTLRLRHSEEIRRRG